MSIVTNETLFSFLKKYTIEECELLREALLHYFSSATEIATGKLLSKDWGNSLSIFNELYTEVNKQLFVTKDSSGFPDAKLFMEKYINNNPNKEYLNDKSNGIFLFLIDVRLGKQKID